MTNFKGNYVTIDDVKIAKNYLSEIELQRLNLLVSQFLDFEELQALEQRLMKMNDWVTSLEQVFKINMYDTYMFFQKLVDAGIYDNGYYRRSNKDITSQSHRHLRQ